MAGDEAALSTPVGSSKLRQALQVANGILATTLPDPGDIDHIRNLHQLAREQLDVMKRTSTTVSIRCPQAGRTELDSRQTVLTELFQLGKAEEAAPERAGGAGQPAPEQRPEGTAGGSAEAVDLDALWLLLEDIRNSLSGRLETITTRTEAALATFSRVERLRCGPRPPHPAAPGCAP